MKSFVFFTAILLSFMVDAQSEVDKDLSISAAQTDDIYLAAETITVDAKVEGDAILAGARIRVRDTITEDLLVSGGNINIEGYIADDIRAAGGELLIDAIVEDDVIVFGGKLLVTQDAIIKGNLIVFSGDIKMNGTVNGNMKAYGGELEINGTVLKNVELKAGELEYNGEIYGTSKLVAEHIKLGPQAKFFKDVEYWSPKGEYNFEAALVNSSAHFNADLAHEHREFPYQFFGIAALGLWIFYLLSAFLIIIILNFFFSSFWTKTVKNLDDNLLKSLGYGLIYLIGIPLIIIVSFLILFGIPIGLFIGLLYLFSILIGHLVLALLIAHYLNISKERGWQFWTLSFVALGIAIILRVITFIPFLGGLISFLILAIAYGAIVLAILDRKESSSIIKT